MSYIPLGLIADILSWLPVKSLLRFRCVSKPWRDLIDDPYFIRSHIDRSMKSKNNLRVRIWGNNIYSLPFDSLNNASLELDWPFEDSVGDFDLSGFCDGLVCLAIGEENAAIWNPATRNYRKLPVAPIEFPENYHGESRISFAIGHDSITDDYKVVRMVDFVCIMHDVEVRVYSMRLNSWRRVRDIPREYGVWELTVLVCGALHWIAGEMIVAFDLATEEHRLLPGPRARVPECDHIWILGELGGSLCIFVHNFGLCTDAWVMKDYGAKESWHRMFSISHVWPSSSESVIPMTYSKSGGKVLMLQGYKKLLWYDIEQQVGEDINIHGLRNSMARMCVDSLVPVNGRETDVK